MEKPKSVREAFIEATKAREAAIARWNMSRLDGLTPAARAAEERRQKEEEEARRRRQARIAANEVRHEIQQKQLSLLKKAERQEKREANKAAHAAARPAELARLKAEKDAWRAEERRHHERRKA